MIFMTGENFVFEKRGGPYGDETCSYNVTFPNGATFRDLMKFILKRYEWGDIRLGRSLFGPIVAKYDKDKFYGDPEKLADIEWKRLKAVEANGGWGLMSYYVTLEEDEEDVE